MACELNPLDVAHSVWGASAKVERMPGILCIALNPTIDVSCDADRVKSMHKTRTSNQRQDPGGGGVNVARVVAELGGKPEIAYFTGGETGVLLNEFLKRTQIDLHPFPMEHPVRLAFAVHEETSGVEYRFVPEGPKVSADELAPVLEFVSKTRAEYVVASGSLPRGAPETTYADMMDALESRNVRFVVDTSGKALKATLDRGGVYLVKPSIGELETLSGRALDEQGAREYASELVERGAAENVAVTLGTKGALLVNAKRILRVPALHVAAKSAVGAGDSFVGAMIWALSEGREIDEAFRLGVAAGAAAALTSGTELCRRADVLSLYDTDLAERRHSLREH